MGRWRAALSRAPMSLQAMGPDIAKGVRAAIATLVPFYLSGRLGHRELIWMALGGWLGTLADPGGQRSVRARTIAGFAVAGTLAVVFGELVAPSLITAAAGLALATFLASLLRSLGQPGANAGTLLGIVSAVASARPGESVLRDGALFLVGAAWATLLSSIIWPVWTHAPVRRALAVALQALADYVVALRALALERVPSGDPRWSLLVRQHRRPVRAAIEEARSIALAVRARRAGESAVGAGLRVLVGLIESQFSLLIALNEALETAGGLSVSEPTSEEAREPPRDARAADRAVALGLARWSPAYEAFARSVVLRTEPPPEAALGLDRGGAEAEVREGSEGSLGDPQVLCARIDEGCRAIGELLTDLDHRRVEPAPVVEAPATAWWRTGLRALADALSPRSLIFRHAVRVAGAVAVSAVIGRWVSPEYPHWVTIATLTILQPYVGATFTRALERVVGTVLGSLVAVVVSATLTHPLALVAAMFPLSIAAVATRPRSYRLFTFFLTPVFVIVAAPQPGDWHVAAARASDALVGGALALVAAVAVFPTWEGQKLPTTLAKMFDAVAAYADAVFAAWCSPASPATGSEVARTRRAAGIALNEADTALEHILSEPRKTDADAASAMQLVTYARRLSGALTALGTVAVGRVPPPPESFRTSVLTVLKAASSRARGAQGEAPTPPPAAPTPDRFVSARLEDVRRYATLIAARLRPQPPSA